jgi:hypothetical protein
VPYTQRTTPQAVLALTVRAATSARFCGTLLQAKRACQQQADTGQGEGHNLARFAREAVQRQPG